MSVLGELLPIVVTDIATTFKVERNATQVRLYAQGIKFASMKTKIRYMVKRGRGSVNGNRRGNDDETR